MRQIDMIGPGQSHVVEVPTPEPNDNQLLVKVTYTGMCHSEVYPWSIAKAGDKFGHETVAMWPKSAKMSKGSKKAIG